MSASGRVCEITNGRFVEAKHEKRWLAVRLLRSKPAGRFGSWAAGQAKPASARSLRSCRRSQRARRRSLRDCSAPSERPLAMKSLREAATSQTS